MDENSALDIIQLIKHPVSNIYPNVLYKQNYPSDADWNSTDDSIKGGILKEY